jgi:TetR/AcrR family transcriptional repressor of nem operon
MEQKSRGPGRPASFERDDVIRRAQSLFWKESADASLDALSRTTGLHKPSLYAAFGGKRGLYLAALDDYLAESGQRMGEVLRLEPLRTALEAFFDADLEVFCDRDGGRGCFLISTAIDAAAGDPEVRQRVERVFQSMRSAILTRIREAIERGALPMDADPELLTDLVCSTHVSLSVEARAGTPRAVLEAKARRVIDLIAPLRSSS